MFFQRSLLLVALGLATSFPVNYANAGASTTTSFTCTGPLPLPGICGTTSTSLGANTDTDASNGITSQVEADIENIRVQRVKKYTSPILTKAQQAPTESSIQVTTWVDGSYVHNLQTGTFNGANIGSISRTGSGIGGADFTMKLPSDAYVGVGFFGGDSDTYISVPTGATATTIAPTAGTYLFYLNGNFTADFTYSTAWMSNSGTNVTSASTFVIGPNTVTATATSTAKSTVVGMDNYEGNVHYKFNLENNWWIEPYVGLAFTYNIESMALLDMQTLKVQGGAKAGTSFMWGDVTVQPTFTLSLIHI